MTVGAKPPNPHYYLHNVIYYMAATAVRPLWHKDGAQGKARVIFLSSQRIIRALVSKFSLDSHFSL